MALGLRFDLHVHTDASPDGVCSAMEMVSAAKARGMDGIAITDHDTAMDSQTALSLSERTGLIVIPGVEVSTLEGHLVVLLPKRSLPAGICFTEAVKSAVSDGSVPFIPHPTDPMSHGVGEAVVRHTLQFRLPIESRNASTAARYNRSATTLAGNLSLPMLGSSDAHVSKAVGDSYTVVEATERSLQASLEAIKFGRTTPHGGQTPMAITIEGIWLRLLKHAHPRKPS